MPAHTQSVSRAILQADLRLNEETQGSRASFTKISDLLTDATGSVYIVDGRIQEISVFDSAGSYQRTIGRMGRGPGEFTQLMAAGFLGDTLWTIDSNLRRITLLDRHGKVLATRQMQSPVFNIGTRRLTAHPEAIVTNSIALGRASPADFMQAASNRQARVPLLRMTHEGVISDSLAWLGQENAMFYIPNAAGGAVFGRQKFVSGPLTLFSSSTSTPAIIVDRRDARSAERSTYGVVALNLDGDTVWTTRVPYEPKPVDRAIVDSVLRSTMRSAMRSGLSPDEAEKALYLPNFLPPVTGGFVATDGSIWLRREDDGRSVSYDVLHTNGNFAAQLSVPSNVTLRAARDNYVWGVELDENDVPTVVRYRIQVRRTGS